MKIAVGVHLNHSYSKDFENSSMEKPDILFLSSSSM